MGLEAPETPTDNSVLDLWGTQNENTSCFEAYFLFSFNFMQINQTPE